MLKRGYLLFGIIPSITFLLFLSSLASASIYIPGTPPHLNLVVKNVEMPAGFVLTEEGSTSWGGCPCYYIETNQQRGQATPGFYGIVKIEKEKRALRVERYNSFYEEKGRKLEYYPSIYLTSHSNLVSICKDGGPPSFAQVCQEQINNFTGLGELRITPTNETESNFYNYYLKSRKVLSLLDWRVTGRAVGNREDKNKILTEFTITGNFKYTPPSDEWITFSEKYAKQYQERVKQNKRNFYITTGILATFVGLISWLILRKKGRSTRKKILLFAVLFAVVYLIFNFFKLIFSTPVS